MSPVPGSTILPPQRIRAWRDDPSSYLFGEGIAPPWSLDLIETKGGDKLLSMDELTDGNPISTIDHLRHGLSPYGQLALTWGIDSRRPVPAAVARFLEHVIQEPGIPEVWERTDIRREWIEPTLTGIENTDFKSWRFITAEYGATDVRLFRIQEGTARGEHQRHMGGILEFRITFVGKYRQAGEGDGPKEERDVKLSPAELQRKLFEAARRASAKDAMEEIQCWRCGKTGRHVSDLCERCERLIWKNEASS